MTDNATSSPFERGVDQVPKVITQILSAAQPGAVFGPPITVGNYTVITASEVAGGGGFGFGGGRGPVPGQAKSPESQQTGGQELAGGGGGGGGGGAASRPVATIVIGPDGVEVKPVLDVTKIALAGITAWGAMLLAMLTMRGQWRKHWRSRHLK